MAFKKSTFGGKSGNKYGNIKTKLGAQNFDSVGERDRYFYLADAQANGKICNLRCQVPYIIEVNGALICKYIADFVYDRMSDAPAPGNKDRHIMQASVVEDFKGVKTKEYILKEKLMMACHGVKIKIVKTPTDII